MARTYPLSLAFNQCLGSKEDPYSFSRVHLEDLRNGETEYLITVQQLIDAIPKTLDPAPAPLHESRIVVALAL